MLGCFTASNGAEVDSRILHLLHLCLHGGLYSCFFISDHEYSFTACSPASSNGRIGSFMEFECLDAGLFDLDQKMNRSSKIPERESM
uniref:Uncharacterized protein n=1 Tax=Trichobilharzia regenti TaxID=157069 RepID=A0AA85J2F3_TRIRE|nr:unnamed protein product [Trichobilharzia regenti]CAH8838423.1 unnamed protein product [Trichobilharzia regenti]